MKRRIACILLALILALALGVTAFAASPALTINAPASVKAGESFTVTVTVSDNPGFSALQFTLGYDKTKLTCTGMETGTVLGGMLSATNGNASAGAKVAAATTANVSGNGVVTTYTFTAAADMTDLGLRISDLMCANLGGASVNLTVILADGTVQTENPAEEPEGETPEEPEEETPEEPEEPGEEETPTEQEEPLNHLFTDTAGHWGEKWINKAVELGLFKGYADGRFGPDDKVTRAQFVTVLYRMSGSPAVTEQAPFSDIGGLSTEFKNAISWAYEKGYVNGKGNNRFDPNGNVTREEAMKILFFYDGGVSGTEIMFTSIYDGAFTDSGKISAWAKSAVYWGVYHELISGTTATTITPGGTATRVQLAKILTSYMEQGGSKA